MFAIIFLLWLLKKITEVGRRFSCWHTSGFPILLDDGWQTKMTSPKLKWRRGCHNSCYVTYVVEWLVLFAGSSFFALVYCHKVAIFAVYKGEWVLFQSGIITWCGVCKCEVAHFNNWRGRCVVGIIDMGVTVTEALVVLLRVCTCVCYYK